MGKTSPVERDGLSLRLSWLAALLDDLPLCGGILGCWAQARQTQMTQMMHLRPPHHSHPLLTSLRCCSIHVFISVRIFI